MRFRPEDDPRSNPAVVDAETDNSPAGTPTEWAENPISDTFAWASYKFVPSWCQHETHFTSRLTQYLWTSCPCCLLFRGIVVGLLLASTFWLLVIAVVLLYV